MSSVTAFLQKSFQSFASSIILPLNGIGFFLTKAAKANSYIETLGKHADSLHVWIKQSYEEDFRRAFETQVRKAVKQLHVSYAKLAFDTTDEPFYGKTRSLHVFNTKGEKYDGLFKFISVSLIMRNKQIPLMSLPVMVGEGNAKPAINLLDYCLTLFKGIRLALFDRGFYIAELIDYLEAKNLRYIIRVPEKDGTIEGFVTQTTELGNFKHQMEYSKAKSKWKPRTTIVVCKGLNDYPWIFATNVHFRTRAEYVWQYTRRWQIETNFRVEDESRIKSKSANHLIRYFYFLISQLLRLLWIVNKNLNYYVPFKKYVDIIEHELLFDYLGIERV